MDSITLHASTGNERVDSILRGLIRIYLMVFPDRIRGFYVTSSYTDGTAVELSDIDLTLVFRGCFQNTEKEIAKEVGRACALLSPIRLDLSYQQEPMPSWDRVQLKLGSLLVYGEDIRAQIQLPTPAEYARESLYFGQRYLMRYLHGPDQLLFPLHYPDPAGEFYGYDTIREPRWYPAGTQHGIKELVNTISFLAKAIVNLRAGYDVRTKGEAMTRYREYIGDEWTEYLETLYASGKMRWGYLVPEAADERPRLRELCRQTPAFENHFLALYRDYLLDMAQDTAEASRRFVVERFAEVIYPDATVLAAVQAIHLNGTGQLQRVAQKTLECLHRAPDTA